MSTQRRISLVDYPCRTGPYEIRTCRWCGKLPPPSRSTFCSDDCVHEYRLRSDVKYLRSYVFARDKGVCAACGLDTLVTSQELSRLTEGLRKSRCLALGFPWHRGKPGGSLWDVDHVLPVSEGGGPDQREYLSNLQTLCVPCHKLKTQADRIRRSA